MIRAFIAIEVDAFPGLLDFMGDLRHTPARLKVVEPENLHITLRFLGDMEESEAEELGQALEVLGDESRFSFELRSAGAFPGLKNPKVIWAGIEEDGSLSHIRTGVEDICESLGLGRDKRKFSPHLTIARVKDRYPKGIRPVIERYRDTDFGTVKVREIKLKKSVLTPQGPIYTDLVSVGLRHP